MRVHSTDKITKLRKLRRNGHSISELMEEFSMPKTTIWHHIHDIELLPEYIKLIKSRQGGSKIRSQNNWIKAEMSAREILNSKKRFHCSLLAMLYWAEGSKRGFVFTNTEGKMIKFFISILKKYFNINDDKIDLTIRIFSNLNRKECLKYWSDITGLPKGRFRIYLNDGGTKGKARYGICRLSVKRGGHLYKLTISIINNILSEVV
jgi:hypothetical protein